MVAVLGLAVALVLAPGRPAWGQEYGLAGINPASGPQEGGTTVTITGNHFTGATHVMFGSYGAYTDAPSFQVVDDQHIVAVTPPGTGTVPVGVGYPGMGTWRGEVTFTYHPTPTVSGILPSFGPAVGGTSVTLSGSGFLEATNVAFGSVNVPASRFTSVSSNQITLNSPPCDPGSVAVRVDSPWDTSDPSPNSQFTYLALTGPSPWLQVRSGTAFDSGLITAVGGTPPYTWTIEGSLPAGIDVVTNFDSCNFHGTTSATPTNYWVMVTATDSLGRPIVGFYLLLVWTNPVASLTTLYVYGHDVGMPGVMMAMVSAPAAQMWLPGGSVTFLDGPVPLGTVTLTNGLAMLTGLTLAAGSHRITAAYWGDGYVLASAVSTNLVSSSADEAIPSHWYNMGDNDSSAVPGGSITNVSDQQASTWGTDYALSPGGSGAVFSNAAATEPAPVPGQRLAAAFDGTGVLSSSGPFFLDDDNFSIEAWVKPASLATHGDIAVRWSETGNPDNGTASYSGWCLAQSGGLFECAYFDDDVSVFGSAPVVSNQWTHLALVRSWGTATFYVNGAPEGSTTNAPNGFAFGPLDVGRMFNGEIDEVRTCMLTGRFDPSMLLCTLPSVTGISPASGPPEGGTPVIVTGRCFTDVTNLCFGRVNIPSSDFTVVDSWHITLVAPPGMLGTVEVTVRNSSGSSVPNSHSQFTYASSSSLALVGAQWAQPIGQGLPFASGVIRAVGGTPPYTFAITAGTLPKGINLDTAGDSCHFSGTTADPKEIYPVFLTVTDAQGHAASQEYAFLVIDPAPIVTGVAPSSGPPGGGTLVTLIGHAFLDATDVAFGEVNIPASAFTVVDDSHITLVAPPGTRPIVDVTVTTPKGTSAANANARFSYKPVLQGIGQILQLTQGALFQPDRISAAGGTAPYTYTITAGSLPAGIGLYPHFSECYFYGTTFAFAGSYVVTVTAMDSKGFSGSQDYTLVVNQPVPAISAISPVAGPAIGGTTVTLTGSDFTGATNVAFGEVNLPSSAFTIVDSSHITVAAPPHLGGPVDVTVTTPWGTSATNDGARFTYRLAMQGLSRVLPVTPGVQFDTGLFGAAGGTLPYRYAITAGRLPAGIGFYTYFDQCYLSGRTYEPVANYAVTITVTDGAASTASQQYLLVVGAPVLSVTGLSATNGPWTGGTSVTITGTDFLNATNVAFGEVNIPASGFTVVDDWTITLATPPQVHAGTVDVIVATPSGASAANANMRFTYNLALTGVPSVLPATQGMEFGPGLIGCEGGTPPYTYTFTVGSLPAGIYIYRYFNDCYFAGTTWIEAGNHSFTLTATDSAGCTGSRQYTIVVAQPVPAVSAVSPSNGPASGGTVLTLTGSDFTGATNVAFGSVNIPASGFTVVDASHIVVVSPAGAPGEEALVTVTTPWGTSANAQFTYHLALTGVPSVLPTTQGVEFGPGLIGCEGGTPPYTYTFTVGSLPAGIYIYRYFNDCYFAGTTWIEAGNHSFTLTVTDSAGRTGSQQYTIVVAQPAPAVSAVSPSNGPATGGATVTLTGRDFTGATNVAFGLVNLPASGFTVVDASHITLIAPVGRVGPVNVTVATPYGLSAITPATVFTYDAVAGFSLVTGSADVSFQRQGTPLAVEYYGANYGPLAIGEFVFQNNNARMGPDAHAYAGTPTFAPDFGSTSAGTNLTLLSNNDVWSSSGFAFTLPTATGRSYLLRLIFHDNYFTAGGNRRFSVNAGLVSGGTQPRVQHLDLAALGACATNASDVVLTLPVLNADSTGLAVEIVPEFTNPLLCAMTWEELSPAVAGVSPAGGQVIGGATVTLTGANFSGATNVAFGAVNIPATGFTVVDASHITLIAPVGQVGPVNVTVATPYGLSAITPATVFTYGAVAGFALVTGSTDASFQRQGTPLAIEYYGANYGPLAIGEFVFQNNNARMGPDARAYTGAPAFAPHFGEASGDTNLALISNNDVWSSSGFAFTLPTATGHSYLLRLVFHDNYFTTGGNRRFSVNAGLVSGGTQLWVQHLDVAAQGACETNAADVVLTLPVLNADSTGLAVEIVPEFSNPLLCAMTWEETFAPVVDGIANEWRARYFGGDGMSTNANSCATADPDRDGMSNLQEYIAGTNPTNAASVLRLDVVSSGGAVSLASPSATNRLYTLEWCGQLGGAWMSVPGQVDVPGTGTPLSLRDTNISTTQFYRVRVRLP
jgi:hypothetical protein